MMDCLIFNHHSLPFDQQASANNALPGFLKTCIQAKNAGLATILVDKSVDQNWFRVELYDGFFFQDWYRIQQTTNSKEELRAFRSIATKQPFFSSLDIADGADLFEVTYEENSYSAVTAAAWHSSPLVGFETRKPWLTSHNQGQYK